MTLDQNGIPSPDAAAPDDSLRVVTAFRDVIFSHSAPPADVAPSALRSALHLSEADWKAATDQNARLSLEQNLLVENGLRLLLQQCVEAAAAAAVPVLQYSASRDDGGGDATSSGVHHEGAVTRLLDTVLWLCEHGHVEGGLVLQLLEDLLDSCTIADCRAVFAYIEAKQHTLARDPILQRGKLILLRTCNQLVRRLSKANDLVFCGRILMLLAFLFPIAEKSAVNFRGAFNTANKTVYQQREDSNKGEDSNNSSNRSAGGAQPFDLQFYSTFWSLQEFFSNPPSAMAKWSTFSESLKTVLATLAAQPLCQPGSTSSEDTAVAADLGSFNIKYLTSTNLLALQLKDHNFRRHVLLQCLFLLDYLSLPPAPAPGRPDKAKEKEREEKRAAMTADITRLREDVRKLLGSIPPRGPEFLQTVDRVLQREQNWIQWKKDGCPPFDKAAVVLKTAAEYEAVERQQNAAKARGGPKASRRAQPQQQRSILGNKQLDELFGWARRHPGVLTDPEAVAVPRLREFVQPLADDMDPASGTEEELHRKHDRVFCWRALRLAARQDIDAFNRFDPTNGVEMVVPPDMLTEEVRAKLHKKQQGPAAAAAGPMRQKKDGGATPQRAAQQETSKPSSKPSASPADDKDPSTGQSDRGDSAQGTQVKGEPTEAGSPLRRGSAKKRNREDEEPVTG